MNPRDIVLEIDIPFPGSRQLTSGHLELLYEEGRARYIKYKGREVLRMIYPALRDENWVTIKGEMQNEIIKASENGFTISYELSYPIGYKAAIEITGDDNTITYVMRGESLAGFKSKRVGLCVHHPILPCAGKKVNIGHENGESATYKFPVLISETWPFTDIVSMEWTTSNADAKLSFEGDIFETEDQRNWTDDSYKTYSGPQYKTPMLYIKKGDTMMHKITLEVHDAVVVEAIETITPVKAAFPKIGYSRSANQGQLTPRQIELAKQLPFDHYRVAFDIDDKNWKNILQEARKEAKLLNVKIELSVSFSSSNRAHELIREINDIGDIDSLLIISDKYYSDIQDEIRQAFPGLKTGFSPGGWFADLNSAITSTAPYDFVSFTVSPQAHQDDNRSILENLGSQHTTIETLNDKIDGVVIHVSPIVFNHKSDDSRLHTSFAAWWTINAICNFASAGYLALFELTGPRGVINDEQKPSPLYRLLKTIKDFDPAFIHKTSKNEIIIENSNNEQVIFQKKSIHE